MRYELPINISEDVLSGIERQIYFLSEGIISYNILKEEGKKVLYLSLNSTIDENDICKRIKEIIDEETIKNQNYQKKSVWQNDIQNDWKYKNIFYRLLDEEVVCIHGEGQISFSEPLIQLYEIFDRVFQAISKEIFKSKEYIFPTLLKTSVLKKVGYFDSFPNLLMFTLRLKNEVNNYREFKECYKELNSADEIGDELINYLCSTQYSLPPTMCYYVYDMFSEKEISNCAVTTRGKSFRYENKYCDSFKRLSDFTIRETVFLGDVEYVSNNVKKYREVATKVMEKFEIIGLCESANDPFFLVSNASSKMKVQNLLGAKYELRSNIDENETIAVASFNLHGQFLSKRFNLFKNADKKEYINTGCIGVGLERFMYGFITQYGIDSKDWPPIINKLLTNEISISDFLKEIKGGLTE